MTFTYAELKGKTVQELRDIAKETGHPAVQGASQMNKEHLLPALCRALGIDAHEHHAARGIDKSALKAIMRELKQKRDAALNENDSTALKHMRRRLHHLNHQIRAHRS
jgi:hypothetical protein